MEWIEIKNPFAKDSFNLSPPSRWSGLKSKVLEGQYDDKNVSTLAVEWIEIDAFPSSTLTKVYRLHPRGGVD